MTIKEVLIKPIIYVLKLEFEKYYIGITLNLNLRLAQHFAGEGSQWTKKFKPIDIIECFYIDCDEEKENKITIDYIKKYGFGNVRGGRYCKLEYKTEPKF
tara:strand:- start:354 stop:653 length:300 start_codon:yes stop_codon:yes gene_type:complete